MEVRLLLGQYEDRITDHAMKLLIVPRSLAIANDEMASQEFGSVFPERRPSKLQFAQVQNVLGCKNVPFSSRLLPTVKNEKYVD